MILVTCETVYWSLLCGFGYLAVVGLGTTMFDISNDQAKDSILIIVFCYVFHSGYYVALDNNFFNHSLKALMECMYVYILYNFYLAHKVNLDSINH
jgi:hypothetical protein